MATGGWYCAVKLCLALLATGGALASSFNCVSAQITPDGSLGAESSVVTPQDTVEVIEGGAARGANLFHSFQEFNVSEGRGAYFFSPNAGIQNILSRVTGGNLSEILGTIGTFGNSNPNLFLINPNGIIFGPNASLDMGNAGPNIGGSGGSFVATTANAVLLGDSGIFSASEPAASNLLTVNPSAFFFNRVSRSEIVNRSTATTSVLGFSTSGLQVPNGRSLLLVGGDVQLDSGISFAPGGRVELGGLTGSGTVGLSVDGNNLSLSFPQGVQRADVSLTNSALVNVAAGGGGSIAVNARNLDISGGFGLFAGIEEGLGAVGSKAGDIEINATDRVKIEGETSATSVIVNVVGDLTGSTALGSAGDININTGSIEGIGSFVIGSATSGQGNAGSVNIQARDTVSFSGISSGVLSAVAPSGVGNGADINIQTRSLSLSNSALLATSTLGQGNAGNIRVNASESVFVRDGSILQAASVGQGGNAGSVTIEGRDGVVPVISFDGVGADGLPSTASTSVIVSPSFVSIGKGGDINITARSLSLTNGARLRTDTFGQNIGQDAGNIRVNAADSVELIGTTPNGEFVSSLFSDTNGAGAAGNLTIDTGKLTVRDGAIIAARTFGSGQGGNLNLTAEQLTVRNGAQANVSSEGTGNAGELTVNAGSIELNNQASLQASTASGNGGNINLQVQDQILMRENSLISAEARGTAAGGNITINVPLLVAFPSENSDIVASAIGGPGGKINIASQGIFGIEERNPRTPQSDINASSDFGVQGEVDINNPDVDPIQGLVVLPAEIVDASNQIAAGCAAGDENKFIITGRGGIPPNPNEPLTGEAVITTWSTLDTDVANRSRAEEPATNSTKDSTPTEIVEANGWITNDKGEIFLTASTPTTTLDIPWLPSNCRVPKSGT